MSETQDRRMRTVLIQLQLCSHVPAVSLDRTARATTDSPLGRKPPGDTGPWPYYDRYRSARDDREREAAIAAAETELAYIRTRQHLDADTEPPEETTRRMLHETAGWAPEDVERSSWRVSARTVRRTRILAGRDPNTGHLPPGQPQDESSDDRQRAVEMRERGLSYGVIAMTLGRPRATIQSWARQTERAA